MKYFYSSKWWKTTAIAVSRYIHWTAKIWRERNYQIRKWKHPLTEWTAYNRHSIISSQSFPHQRPIIRLPQPIISPSSANHSDTIGQSFLHHQPIIRSSAHNNSAVICPSSNPYPPSSQPHQTFYFCSKNLSILFAEPLFLIFPPFISDFPPW